MLLARLFHNVVKITSLQHCTMLYLRCVFAGFRQELSDLHIPYTVEGGATLWSGAEKLKLYGFMDFSQTHGKLHVLP